MNVNGARPASYWDYENHPISFRFEKLRTERSLMELAFAGDKMTTK